MKGRCCSKAKVQRCCSKTKVQSLKQRTSDLRQIYNINLIRNVQMKAIICQDEIIQVKQNMKWGIFSNKALI